MNWARPPRILLMSDVSNWAWAIKSAEIKKHLDPEFIVTVTNVLEDKTGFNTSLHDLYLSYGWSYCNKLNGVPKDRRISGVTAHKDAAFFKSQIVPALTTTRWHHANSILLKEELERGDFKRVFYVPNGVNEEKFHEIKPIPLERNALAVGHVGKKCGHGSDVKGQMRFIEPACRAAEAQYKGHYNNYKNHIPHEQMVDFYQDIDVFIVASETDGTPNGALEAAACARPIISNRIGNMPEFIVDGYNGFLVDRNVEAYVEKLNWLKTHREELIQMGKNARETIESAWTWKIMAENYRTMFTEILNEVGIR